MSKMDVSSLRSWINKCVTKMQGNTENEAPVGGFVRQAGRVGFLELNLSSEAGLTEFSEKSFPTAEPQVQRP